MLIPRPLFQDASSFSHTPTYSLHNRVTVSQVGGRNTGHQDLAPCIVLVDPLGTEQPARVRDTLQRYRRHTVLFAMFATFWSGAESTARGLRSFFPFNPCPLFSFSVCDESLDGERVMLMLIRMEGEGEGERTSNTTN